MFYGLSRALFYSLLALGSIMIWRLTNQNELGMEKASKNVVKIYDYQIDK